MAVDSKIDYPVACNAAEKLVVHRGALKTALPAVCEALRAAGRLEVSYVPVDEEGRVAAAAVAAALTEHTVLVTVMHSNNEVGEP